MNPMIAALQKSRSDVSQAAPAAVPAENPGDALIEKLSSIEAKIDQMCAMMGMKDDQEAPGMGETAPKEDVNNDDGY